MNLKVLSLASLGILGAGAVGAGGIAMSVGSGQRSEETTKTPSTPTISQRLLSRGYTYNPPKLTNHNNLVQSCTENLLNKTGLDNSKLYGCGVAKLDIYDSGNQFGDTTVDYLNFASEIFVRKEDEGWRINTRINNYSGLIYQHLLTHYKKRDGKNLEIEESFLIEVGDSDREEPRTVDFPGNSQQYVGIANINEKLNIKLPGEANYWYQGDNYLIAKPTNITLPTLTKEHKETKEWSRIWIDKSATNQQWMFQDMEVFIDDMKYSQVFCNGTSCGAGSTNMLYKLKHSQGSPAAPSFWWDASSSLVNQAGTEGSEIFNTTEKARQPILDFIKGSRGEWVNSDQICVNSTSVEDVNNEKLSQLELWCSKK